MSNALNGWSCKSKYIMLLISAFAFYFIFGATFALNFYRPDMIYLPYPRVKTYMAVQHPA